MSERGLNSHIETMLADPNFQADCHVQEAELKKLRKAIKDADTPQWMTEALEEMHAMFPEGTSLRYRSSTNTRTCLVSAERGCTTQDPGSRGDEGGWHRQVLKGVYASLWNFRAFVERDFHRIDHTAAAMGVLVHPNYSMSWPTECRQL